MQRWTTETGKPSVALEILLFNFGVCVFYLGGFCSHSFYYLDIFEACKPYFAEDPSIWVYSLFPRGLKLL